MVNTLLEQYHKMKEFNMEQPSAFPLELVERVSKALSRAEITDEYIAYILDISGRILRKYRIFDVNKSFDDFVSHVIDADGNETVSFTLLLKECPSTVAQTNFELVSLLSKLDKPIPNTLNVCFGVAS